MQIFGYFQRFSYSYFARLALISEIAETIQARCGKPESIGPFANRSFRKKVEFLVQWKKRLSISIGRQ